MSLPNGAGTALDAHNVTVRFGGHLALDDVSISAEVGQVTGLIGPNGAGKTTLFNVITGLLSPQRGEVRLGGRNITSAAPYRRARLGLARTFQRLELFGLLTVRENVDLAASVGRTPGSSVKTSGLLEMVGIRHIADVRADELPTGQARLVELARALATSPKVLLLDEPGSGQDEQETEAFGELLNQIAGEGIAVVLVEHDVGLVMRTCQTVHVLDFGSVLAVGTPAEIQSNQAVLAAYLGGAA